MINHTTLTNACAPFLSSGSTFLIKAFCCVYIGIYCKFLLHVALLYNFQGKQYMYPIIKSYIYITHIYNISSMHAWHVRGTFCTDSGTYIQHTFYVHVPVLVVRQSNRNRESQGSRACCCAILTKPYLLCGPGSGTNKFLV